MSAPSGTDPERDARLSALYRAESREQPPVTLDDAIRASARRAVAAQPRLAGSPFSRSWRVPTSIAAVLVLSVSLVTMMNEEAPEVMQPSTPDKLASRQDSGPQTAKSSPNFTMTAPRASLSDGQPSSGVGLKPSRSTSASGVGLRPGAESVASEAPVHKQLAPAERTADSAPAVVPPSQPVVADRSPGAIGLASRLGSVVESPRQAANEQSSRMAAPTVDGGSQIKLEADSARAPAPRTEPVAVAKSARSARVPSEKQSPVMTDALQASGNLPPDKWLERIDELRKQGRLEEAKAALQEFRKRYPNHALPPVFKEWVVP